jgi:hypothetical protein
MPNLNGGDKATVSAAKNQQNNQQRSTSATALRPPDTSERIQEVQGSLTPSSLEKPSKYWDNPDFLYPGGTVRDNAGNLVQIQRGYIRRLNEFFARMPNAPQLNGRKVKFQFQPEQVVRNVTANMSTHFFFNQDPAQLAVPKYGESTYTLELLFNREAELRSGKYKIGNKIATANLEVARRSLQTRPEDFITGEYNPSWVCGIGILADLMVLDAVIGQGFNQEMSMIVQNIASKMDSEPAKTENTDDTDKSNEAGTPVVAFQFTTDSENPNLGNTAFLTPVPVRVQLAPWMMVEGFVLSSEVNIHKFNSNYVPTQAKVFLTVQAIYMGFVKEKTLFTIDTPIPTGSDASPDATTNQEEDVTIRKATIEGLSNFFDKVSATRDYVSASLLGFAFAGEPKVKFDLKESDAAKNWRPSGNADRDISFTYDAKVKIYWHSYIDGASNSRGIQGRISASGGTLKEINYFTKENVNSIPIPEWGTKEKPYVMTSNGPIRFNGDKWVIDDGSNGYINNWSRDLPKALVPFEQDKFNFEMEIKINATRFGASYTSPQSFHVSFDKITANYVDLFKSITIKFTPPSAPAPPALRP